MSTEAPAAASEATATICAGCGATFDGARSPRGWKRAAELAYCGRCFRARYLLRAVTIPLAGPAEGTWEELREALRACWSNATTVANWAVRELTKADAVRTPEMEKLPPMPRLYLYPGARAVAPDMDTGSVVALLQAVERRYRARRFQVVWLRKEAPPSYRYPAPYPVHNQRWSAAVDDRGRLVVSAPLAGRRALVLRGGQRFRRQRRAVEKLIAGTAMRGELALYERGSDVLCKMVLWLPREPRAAREKKGTLHVRTCATSLLTYWVDGEEEDGIRHYHADHARRWVREHERRIQRTSDDLKAEHRRPRRERERRLQLRKVWAEKHGNRMSSLAHEASAVVAGYAERRGVARVELDLTNRAYLPLFPYALFVERVRYKLDAIGVALVVASGTVVSEDQTPLAEEA